MQLKNFIFILSYILCSMFALGHGFAEEPVVGGESPTEVTKMEVIAAANFAIKEQEKGLRKDKDTPEAKLSLVAILRAEEQVVAGMNYRLTLKVKLNGQEKQAEAIVWWQAWNKETPYKLTSWKWLVIPANATK